jgi:pimeloyl-ACP methyl ester carboxylesterase
MLGRFKQIVFLAVIGLAGGCLPQLPDNTKTASAPQRTLLYGSADASFSSEDGVTDALWLEVQRGDGETVGGYVSQNDATRNALIIMLHGASTFDSAGGPGSALYLHQTMGAALQRRGFRTWSISAHECGTAYGQDDTADVVAAVDWLAREGKVMLGVDHVYVVGYSTGGTATVIANRQRKVDAVSTVSALMEPFSIENRSGYWRLIAGLYPQNIGACQMLTTLNTYGPPGSAGWDALNTVAHIDELKSPMLVFHGDSDPIFETSNAQDLQARYDDLTAQGVSLPELEFIFLPGVGHFPTLEADEICGPIADFFQKYGAVQGGAVHLASGGAVPVAGGAVQTAGAAALAGTPAQ